MSSVLEAVDRAVETAGGSAAQAKSLFPWPPLEQLPEPQRDKPADFPFDALGPILGLASSSISNDVQAPGALAAGSVLAAASLAAQPHADVILPHRQRLPLSLFVLTGAGSGDRKTAVDAVALHPVEKVRRGQARDYLREVAATAKDDKAIKPAAHSLTIGKATTEGLQQMLRHQPSVGLFSSEGAEMLGGHSMREERRSAGLAWLLKAWGGETLDALTRSDGLSMLLGRRVAMHILVQPVVLRNLLSDPLANGQGLLARCLIAQPDTLAGTRTYRECDPLATLAVKVFHEKITALLTRPPQLHPDGDGSELQPRDLQLSAEASALWIEFYDEIERQQGPGCALEHARPFASKTAEHAARIAGVIEMLGDPQSAAVSGASMDGAIRVADFYLNEHIRLTGAGSAERRQSLLHALFHWMQERGRAVAHRDVLQRSPNPVRVLKAEGIAPMLEELERRNYIRRIGNSWEARPNA